MSFGEAKPLRELTRDEKRGLILENDKRILTFQVRTFQALEDHMIEMAGPTAGRTILHQLGSEVGRTAFDYSKERITADNVASVFDSVVQARGWGRVVSLEKARNDVYVASFRDCPMCYEIKRNEPVCDLVRGIVDGRMEAFLGRKAHRSAEKQCAAMQGELCIFEATF